MKARHINWKLLARLGMAGIILFCDCPAALAQSRAYIRIKELPVVRFEWECTKPEQYPKAKLDRIVRPLLPGDWPPQSTYGDRAYVFDLNGDGVNEYFVPLYCGATGNCFWAIIGTGPTRVLGRFSGESVFVHKRIGRWARLSIASHENVSYSGISTYSFRKGRYRSFGKYIVTSAYEHDFPRTLLTVEPLCVPDYVPGSIHP